MTRVELAKRAKNRCLEVDDYWYKAERFIRSLGEIPKEQMTLKQRNWLTALELDLGEVGE
ncbi:MAG: hypothetical protein WC786_06170 [Patescibacteria group bacterium]